MGCEVCGHMFAERHRLIPGHLGGLYYDWNILYLCPNHHTAFHFLISTAAKPAEARTPRTITRWNSYQADEALWHLFERLYPYITVFPNYLQAYTGPRRFEGNGYSYINMPDRFPGQAETPRFRSIYEYKHHHEADEPELEELVNALCDALQAWRDQYAIPHNR